jgi:16S rRNA (cytosine967-C5)-methyltransferase
LCAAEIFGETLSGRSLTAAFEDAFRRHGKLSAAERSVVREICYEGLRSLGLIEAQLAKLLLTPVRHPALRHLLLVGLAQLNFTRAKPYAIVDHAVQAADRLGQPAARGLVNAVLRNYLRRKDELSRDRWTTPEARYGFPGWWMEKLREQHPGDWEAIAECANRHPPMTLRVNRRRTTVEAYLGTLQAAGIPARSLGAEAVLIEPRSVLEVPGFAEGLVSVQDAGAQMAAGLMDLKDGQRVLDACAAPGGKSGHILERAEVDLLAIDQDAARVPRIKENLTRLALPAIVRCADAARPETWWDGKPFQRILVDAPCSGSGVARRHPDIRWNRRPSDMCKFATLQADLLSGVWQVLENSGKLLYATCSIFDEENEQVVNAFLARQADARLIFPDAHTLEGGRVLPNDDRDGFFYALLEKR